MGGVLFKWKDQWLFDEVSRQSKIPFDTIKDGFDANISELFVGNVSEKQFWYKVTGTDTVNPQIISETFHDKSLLDEQILNLALTLKKNGLDIGILSNVTPETRQILPSNWIGEFDHVFFSDEIKLAKPDPEIFSYVAKKLPECDIIFIDDKQENIDAGRSHGIHSILFSEYESLREDIMKLTSITL